MVFRRTVLKAVAAVLMLAYAGTAGAQGAQDPRAFVDDLAAQSIQIMVTKGLSDEERIAKFRTLFVSAVDLPVIARFVLARHWNAATPAQQQEFLKLFEDIVVLTWSTRFKDYAADLSHATVGASPDGERGVFVESLVKRQSQDPIRLGWRLRASDGGYKVVDLIVEGTSMSITYRQEYGSVIRGNGGSIDALLDAMRRKITQLREQPAR